MTSMRLLLLRS